jgi:hypothetical protein
MPVSMTGILVSENATEGGVAPVATAATTVYGPPSCPIAVGVMLACPVVVAPMVAVCGSGAMSAPLPEPVKVTTPPLTDSPPTTGATVTTSGAKAVLPGLLGLSPLAMVSVNPCDSNAPMSGEPTRGLPRWSAAGTGLPTGPPPSAAPASMAREPGSSAKVCVCPP